MKKLLLFLMFVPILSFGQDCPDCPRLVFDSEYDYGEIIRGPVFEAEIPFTNAIRGMYNDLIIVDASSDDENIRIKYDYKRWSQWNGKNWSDGYQGNYWKPK